MGIRQGTCVACSRTFTHESRGGALPARCPKCSAEHAAVANREKLYRWRAKNPEKVREIDRRYNAKRALDPEALRRKRENEARRMYGIEPEQLRALEKKQKHQCAICKGKRTGPGNRLHIDHCHDSLKVRGLLCSKCNTMLGLAGEDATVLRNAIAYLAKHR